MPEDDRMREVTYDNRARIEGLEREMDRQRQRTHELSAQVGIVSTLADRLTRLTEELRELGERFERLSRRALERPTPSAWSAGANWIAVLVAVIALVLASTR